MDEWDFVFSSPATPIGWWQARGISTRHTLIVSAWILKPLYSKPGGRMARVFFGKEVALTYPEQVQA